ncbi:MAG: hypothetical protein E7373_05075 [Clostridiales bacterium]|nr:hypothetical protein [Clostridiales bacterium]
MSIFDEIKCFYDSYKGQKRVIGQSVKGKPIYAFAVKKTKRPTVLVQCAIHAREFVTAKLCLLLAKDFYSRGKKGTVWFLPMLNPDGVEMVINGDQLYKANANGVDLNVNFPAKWGKGKSNVFIKGAENFVGESPLSEPETRSLCDFTLEILPDMSISYHSKGEEIYWEFFQNDKTLNRDKRLAEVASKLTGYPLVSVKGSCGGYKDWCIEHLKIPALTIEVGSDSLSHPINTSFAEEIFIKNRDLLIGLIEELDKND